MDRREARGYRHLESAFKSLVLSSLDCHASRENLSFNRSMALHGAAAVFIAVLVILASTLVVSQIGPSKPSSTSTVPNGTLSRTQTSTSAGSGTLTGLNGYALYAVQLTDPPVVPAGTQQLNLTYSNLGLHLQSPSRWIMTNATGTVNLLKLMNLSKTIAVAKIPSLSVVDAIKFDISSVQIRVNGTVYGVTAFTNTLDVPIVGATEVQILGAALLDLSPRVLEIGSGGSTYFFMVPSATAIVEPSSAVSQSSAQLGAVSAVTSEDESRLAGATGAAEVISNALSASGNITSLSITLKNTGNVTLYLLAVQGHGNFTSKTPGVCSTPWGESSGLGDSDKSTTTTTTTSCGERERELEHPNEVTFALNGTTLVQVKGEDHSVPSSPLAILPSQSVTISFSGIFTEGNSNVPFVPVSGLTYTFHLDFSNDVHISFNVTAG